MLSKKGKLLFFTEDLVDDLHFLAPLRDLLPVRRRHLLYLFSGVSSGTMYILVALLHLLLLRGLQRLLLRLLGVQGGDELEVATHDLLARVYVGCSMALGRTVLLGNYELLLRCGDAQPLVVLHPRNERLWSLSARVNGWRITVPC